MIRWLILFLACSLISGHASAQSPDSHLGPVLASADMREAIDLDGPWNWSSDPYRDGLSGFHGGQVAPGHRRYEEIDTTAAMQSDQKALYEYDMDRSPTVHLPQSFVTHSPDMRRYNGLVWYQRRFTAHAKPGERGFLRFGFLVPLSLILVGAAVLWAMRRRDHQAARRRDAAARARRSAR